MKKETKAKAPPGVVLTSSSQSLPTGRNLKNVGVGHLLQAYPHLFDKRVSDDRRFSVITQKQWQEHLSKLECAVCGAPGGKCKCNAEDFIKEE